MLSSPSERTDRDIKKWRLQEKQKNKVKQAMITLQEMAVFNS